MSLDAGLFVNLRLLLIFDGRRVEVAVAEVIDGPAQVDKLGNEPSEVVESVVEGEGSVGVVSSS